MKPESVIARHLANVRSAGRGDPVLAGQAVALAAAIWKRAHGRLTPRQRVESIRLVRLMDDPAGKDFTLALADQVLRARSPGRAADQFHHLVRTFGIPAFLGPLQKFLVGAGSRLAHAFPGLVVPVLADRMRRRFASVIRPAAPERLRQHLLARRSAGFGVDVVLLGDAVLGEADAERYLEDIRLLLAEPAVESLSLRLADLHAHPNPLAFEATVEAVAGKLRRIFRTARDHPTTGPGGQAQPKFVLLETAESTDLRLTAEVFQRTLSEPEFLQLAAGIVLQAYLPEAIEVQQELLAWAVGRVARGGAPIKIRLVKGSRLTDEAITASLHGWAPATFTSPSATDANFKRLLHHALEPDHAAAARIGLATHNPFDLAYGLLLSAHLGVADRVDFEFLEGMAPHEACALRDFGARVVLHTPIVHRTNFPSAVACLMRRLNEATAPGGFLRDSHSVTVGSPAWEKHRERFLEAVAAATAPPAARSTRNDRSTEAGRHPSCAEHGPFVNEPPTDWAIAANRAWILGCLDHRRQAAPVEVPLVVAGQLRSRAFPGIGHDPSRPRDVAYAYAIADEETLEDALAAAVHARRPWAARPVAERRQLLVRAAGIMARERGETIATLVLDVGKSIAEADAEVNEAIDSAHCYARAFDDTRMLADVRPHPAGTVVVAPPWNNPYSIAAGGVLAALVAGNTVILKPAPEAVLAGWTLASHLWEAGVPRDVLQFVVTPDNQLGRWMISDARTDLVLLTGSFETARWFQRLRPDLRLHAATSGKNAIVITAEADLEQAIRDLVDSAFRYAGQHCSAASLAIVEASVYDNPAFRRQLRDAAASLPVGPAWDPRSIVTTTIRPPARELLRAQSTLDPGEEWLLEPQRVGGHPNLWSPGIKLGVLPGSWFHRTECLGPVLGVMRATDVAAAVRIQNDSSFGLVGGLHSLDDREIAAWRDHVQVGNACVNRPTVGAIVGRQPFGGWHYSSFGPGAKAGGPNFVHSLVRWEQVDLPAQQATLDAGILDLLETMKRWLQNDHHRRLVEAAARSYRYYWDTEFSLEHDRAGVLGQSNIFRYRPLPRGVLLRLRDPFRPTSLAMAVLAAVTTGVMLELSLQRASAFADALGTATTIEAEDQFADRLRADAARYDRLRIPQGTVVGVLRAAQDAHVAVSFQDILANGRLELPQYLREQSISHTTHRHGTLPHSPRP